MRTRRIGQGDRAREVSVLALGAMNFGTTTDEATSFAVLDRYVEAGGTFVDTSGNYAFWNTGSQGGESEQVLGRWLRTAGADADRVTVATKVGARPTRPSRSFDDAPLDGLAPAAVRASVERSLEHLGRDRVDVLYAHVPDAAVPLEEQAAGFAALVDDGLVGLLGLSNHWSWQVERLARIARDAGLPGYDLLQYEHTYLRARTDPPTPFSTGGSVGKADGGLLSLLADDPARTLVAYSPLLNGAYTRSDKPLGEAYRHAGSDARLAVLAEVAAETGRSANEVVLAWLTQDPQVVPLAGPSSVAQLDEVVAGVGLGLTQDQVTRLSQA